MVGSLLVYTVVVCSQMQVGRVESRGRASDRQKVAAADCRCSWGRRNVSGRPASLAEQAYLSHLVAAIHSTLAKMHVRHWMVKAELQTAMPLQLRFSMYIMSAGLQLFRVLRPAMPG